MKNNLNNLNKNIDWIIPIIKNKKKIYDILKKNDDIPDDTIHLTLAASREDEYEIYSQYKSNEITDEENKYYYYYRGISKYFKQYTNTNRVSNIMINKMVNNNIECMVNYFGNFNSTCVNDSKLVNKKYITNRYIKGLTRLEVENLKQHNSNSKLIKLTDNDRILINGFIILPYQIVNYYKLNLPNSNILKKSELDKINFLKSDIINDNSTILLNKINDSYNSELFPQNENNVYNDENFVYHKNTIFNKLNYYYFENSSWSYDDLDKEKEYSVFLDKMIPTIDKIIHMIKPNIKNGVSYENILSYLEPYLIYSDDITINQYQLIDDIVQEEIVKYKKLYLERIDKCSRYLNKYKTYVLKTDLIDKILLDKEKTSDLNLKIENLQRIYIDNLNNIFNKKVNEDEEDNEIKCSNNELLNNMYKLDNIAYFTNLITMSNITLFQSENIEETVQNELEKTSLNIENTNDDNECKNLVLAKRYVELSELSDDDDKLDLKFDKKYDDQIKYDIMDEFEQDRNVLSAEELLNKLKNHLIKNVGVKDILAERDALSMIEGFKRVIDGDYAILDVGTDEIRYFIRENNKWRLDNKLNNITEKQIQFCNVRENCIAIKKDCDTNEKAKEKIKKNLLKDIVDNFETNLENSYEALKKKLENNEKKQKKYIERLQKYNNNKNLKNNTYYLKLSSEVDPEDIVISPYEQLRDIILGQSDIVKKYNDILIFINNFCYEAESDELIDLKEDENNDKHYWYFCKETDIKLLPNFYEPIARTFFYSKELYDETMNDICNHRGVLSDDGDKIVDKYSGYYIKNIEFDESEGYDEKGFKQTTRSVMENTFTFKDNSVKYSTKSSKIIQKVLNKIDEKMHISMDDKYNFIIQQVLKLMDENIGSEKDYNERMKNKKKKGRTKSYQDSYNDLLIYSIISIYIISIQISIPSVYSVKTYDNCNKSFDGYPLNGSSDGLLTYVCCVFLKTRSDDGIWKSVPKSNKSNFDKVIEKMKTKLKMYMDNKILIKEDIQRLINEKKEWLIKNPDIEIIPETFKLGNWTTFLPPHNLDNIKRATNISSEFNNLLINDIKNASYTQFARLWDLKGKIRKYSLMIQESIQSVIKNQPLLLNTIDEIPFVENACCHEGMNSVYKFFAEKENNIFKYNKILYKLENIYNKFNKIHKPPMIYSIENTKIIFPELTTDFNEETIYLFFMKHCKFNSGIRLPEQIADLCINNTSEINNTMSLEEKIETLKKEGNIYTNDSLYQLLSIVHSKNSIELDINEKNISPRQEFEDFINYLNRLDNKIINNELLDFFNKIFDRYEVYYEKDDDLIINFNKYLTDENDILIKNILNFTQQYSTIKNIKSF